VTTSSHATTVGRYTLLSKVGEGGMGVVHLAEYPPGHHVAIKLLRPHVVSDDHGRARMAREVTSLRRVRSPRVAEVYDADPWGETPYIVTRFVPGPSLQDRVGAWGPLQGAELEDFARGLAQALAAVHAAGVLHRDIKPSNVLLEGSGPVLIDFGLAQLCDDARITYSGWLLGTPGYLAPEILYGEDPTPQADVHSWAATVVYAATARGPYGTGPAIAVMDRVRRGEHDLTGLPDDLRTLVSAALDPDPARRPTLREIIGRLGGAAASVPAPGPVVEDPFTLPLALAAQGDPSAPTEVEPRRTRHLPADPGHGFWDRDRDDAEDPDDLPVDLAPLPERTGPAARLRRGLVVAALALVAGAVISEWPYWGLALVLGVSWLLRTCTMTVTAHGDRRRLRGTRWYDVLIAPLSAPWYLVAALPGTLLLALWAVGIGIAGALLCYAAGLSTAGTLFVSGVGVAVGLWVGPGASYVRWPVRVVAHAVARRTGRWAVLTVVLVAVAGFVGHQASLDVGWAPFGRPPLIGR
jgi:hypothetical protein